jgi:hypothetical protein
MQITDRDIIERSFARRFSRLSSRHRRELLELVGDPPDASRVPESFWVRVEEETQKELAIILFLIWMQSAQEHGLDFDRAEKFGERYAERRAAKVAGGYTDHSRDLLKTTAKQWEAGEVTLTRGTLKIFGPRRAAGIAVNETTTAQTDGGEIGIDKTVGISVHDTWYTRADGRVCPVCKPLHDTPRGTWGRLFPDGPPAHTRCRCWIRYSNRKRRVEIP